jgi:hypothetical protein
VSLSSVRGQEEESSYHMLCWCPAFGSQGTEIFETAWLELTDIRRASGWVWL